LAKRALKESKAMKRIKVAGFSSLIALIVMLGGRHAATETPESQTKGQGGDIPTFQYDPAL
jgi:hypothetical protein